MEQKYFQILNLLQEQSNTLPRLQKIHEIVRQPDFLYKKGPVADFVLSVFLKSSYWLDRELFDNSYLYKKDRKRLTSSQMTHLKMVDIGVLLLDKGFPIQYNPAEYAHTGSEQLGPYVKTLVEQILQKHAHIATKSPSISFIMTKTKNVHH